MTVYACDRLDGHWRGYKPILPGANVTITDDGTEVVIASSVGEHEHDGLEHLPDIVALLSNGVTGTKTIGGYRLTFNHGVLTGFEQV